MKRFLAFMERGDGAVCAILVALALIIAILWRLP